MPPLARLPAAPGGKGAGVDRGAVNHLPLRPIPVGLRCGGPHRQRGSVVVTAASAGEAGSHGQASALGTAPTLHISKWD